jgi:molecular chaperone Hsp33
MLGEMLAAAVLMQSTIKFDGAMVLQIFGDGPVKLAVAEVQSDLRLRATATVAAPVEAQATLSEMVNAGNQGRCAITLDPRTVFPGQQPYQGVVPLVDGQGNKLEQLSAVLEQYMLRSEQIDTHLVLAASDKVAAGLLVQRMPVQGRGNLEGSSGLAAADPRAAQDEDYNRIAMLAGSLRADELLTLDMDTLLRRLFWEEQVVRFEPLSGDTAPRFACNCSRERVAKMIVGLGQQEATEIVAERGGVEVACEFCGVQYRFDAVDTAQLFTAGVHAPRESGPH